MLLHREGNILMEEKKGEMTRNFSWSSFDKRIFYLLDKTCAISPFLILFITFVFDNLSVKNGVLVVVLLSPLLLFQILFWRNGACQISFDFDIQKASFFMLRGQNVIHRKIEEIRLVKRLGNFFTFFFDEKRIRYKCKDNVQTRELTSILNDIGKLHR